MNSDASENDETRTGKKRGSVAKANASTYEIMEKEEMIRQNDKCVSIDG